LPIGAQDTILPHKLPEFRTIIVTDLQLVLNTWGLHWPNP
jgi:hypothetical protein